jgi:hypothetical protein
MAGLVRLEALWRFGGVYLDSDMEMYRPLDALRYASCFAGWEDHRCVPDAVIGAEPAHPAVGLALEYALANLHRGPWHSGPGATTTVFPSRPDVLLLPPGSFYPVHYTRKRERQGDVKAEQPWCFGQHRWHASWLPPHKR